MAPQEVYSTKHGQKPSGSVESRLFSRARPPLLEDLKKLCARRTSKDVYVRSSNIVENIPIYDATTLSLQDSSLQDEWHHLLLRGPGVFVLKNMYTDISVLEATNAAFNRIIQREAASAKGDHFAAGGKNDRIWNSFSKHALEHPESFVQYYSNPWLARVCEAWLGPAYRITAQTNIVQPGGQAQVSHRDYHLGFQSEAACARVPKAMQVASQLLTLQGAVAHTDMPLESGPTRFLPFSQSFEEGYMAYRLPQFTRYFEEAYTALPLRMGDGIFFNPAIMHAAGENKTADFSRSANLVQVSSAFGKPMETVDSLPLIEKCWPTILDQFKETGWSCEIEALLAALGEGYPFPTNLDRRPPAPGGMAPASEQDVLKEALDARWEMAEVVEALRKMRKDSLA